MKSAFLLAGAVFWAGLTSAALAAPARVQGGAATSGFATTLTTPTFGAAVGSGHDLAIGVLAPQSTPPTLSDNGSGGTVYTLVATSTAQSGVFLFLYYAANVTDGLTTVTATWATGGTCGLFVDEISGVATASPIDVSATNVQASAAATANAVTSGAATTTANGEFVWGITDNITGGSTAAAGTGFTGAATTGFANLTEYQVQATAGSIAATFTAGTASQPWLSGMMAFKLPGGGGGGSSGYGGMLMMGIGQ